VNCVSFENLDGEDKSVFEGILVDFSMEYVDTACFIKFKIFMNKYLKGGGSKNDWFLLKL